MPDARLTVKVDALQLDEVAIITGDLRAKIERLQTELALTEADLAVAVHEATTVRTRNDELLTELEHAETAAGEFALESATNRETGGAWRDRALTAEAQRQAALDLWDFLENVAGFCDCSDGGACITNAESHQLSQLTDSLGTALGAAEGGKS